MESNTGYLKDLCDWMTLRNYSVATVKAYSSALRQFLEWRESSGLGPQFGLKDARAYLLYRYKSGRRWQTINGDYSALQKFYVQVLGLEWSVDHIPRPRREHALPAVLSQKEVQRLIEAGRTFKHQVFIVLLYATGLRLSEALSLEVSHVDGERRQLRVVKGKGSKDRYVAMPQELLLLLRDYYRAYRPERYLFNGKYAGSKWAPRSAQYAIEQARKAAGIDREVSPHILRHCYATHHLEGGTNLVYLKGQLGHKNLKTTARYVNLCVNYHRRVRHPLRDMELQLGGPKA